MRARLILLVAATTSLVLVAFLVPLALLVRASAADRAVSAAAVEAQGLAPVVATADRTTLTRVVDRANAAGRHPVTVFLPGGAVVGVPASRSSAVNLAATGRSLTARARGGREIVVAVAGLADGTAVIRTFVTDAELGAGVVRAWLVLAGLAVGLLVVSVLVADQLARTLVRPLAAVAHVSHVLARGDLAARAAPDGPPEVRQVSAGLNLLADRIAELMAGEREMVADLSHRLRTPLTALRVDAESLSDPQDRARMTADVDAVVRTADGIIRAARRPVGDDAGPGCDAAEVVADRARFWSALADEEERPMRVTIASGPVAVRAARDDLTACVDALLGNVFAHTPEGCAMDVSLWRRPGGGAVVVVSDEGPGLPDVLSFERGRSGNGSTGLGLDIVRRVATGAGGGVTLGRPPGGGTVISVELPAPA